MLELICVVNSLIVTANYLTDTVFLCRILATNHGKQAMKTTVLSKTEAQLFIEKFLSQDDFYGLSQSVVDAYSALEGVYKATPALGAFMVGYDLRPHLLRVFVEHQLKKYTDLNAGFSHEIRFNLAKNCQHLRLFKNNLALTSHYMGAKCERPEARSALYKANLSQMNLDFFDYEKTEQDILKNVAYAQIMHGGFVKPISILINIPTEDQIGTIGSFPLAIPDENKTKVEEIVEEESWKLKNTLEELKNGS